jgi:hypothetical protein
LAGLFYKLTLKLPLNNTFNETNTNEAIALGIEINKQVNYRGGQLNRFVSVEYKSEIVLGILAGLFYKLTLKLPLNNTFNTITMRFIIGRLNVIFIPLSDIRRDTSDYLSKNAEQEVSVKLGLDYQKDSLIGVSLAAGKYIIRLHLNTADVIANERR